MLLSLTFLPYLSDSSSESFGFLHTIWFNVANSPADFLIPLDETKVDGDAQASLLFQSLKSSSNGYILADRCVGACNNPSTPGVPPLFYKTARGVSNA